MAQDYLRFTSSVTMRRMPNTEATHQDRPELAAISLSELQSLLKSRGQPAFRAKQVIDWRNKGILNPDEMTNIPAALRDLLNEAVRCESLRLVRRECSVDGTRKYVFALNRERAAGKMVESVLIPESSRGTVCISSQVGCVLDCPFCHTGTQAFEANLTAGEILAQVLMIKADLRRDPLIDELHNEVTHIVYMGMGEPLANETGLHESLQMLLADDGLKLSRRRITVSTSGLVPQINRLGEAFNVNLAISLHAATDQLRDELVPINNKYKLKLLRDCLNRYTLGKQRHITLEYVLLKGCNDRDEDIQALIDFVNPERERVNLIQFNPYPGTPYEGSSKEHMSRFAQHLISKGIRATVRRSRGDDIMAACGQLKAATSKV